MPDGVLIVDKPVGPTSHDVVRTARKTFKTKVGHTGTLDPAASGVLALLVGKATRLASFYQHRGKEYLAEIRLGVVTDTFDAQGAIEEVRPVPPLTDPEIEAALEDFRGTQEQIPPMFSAVKIGGRRLYQLARQGLETPRPARTIQISKLEQVDRTPDSITLRVICSAGTYVRALAQDLGRRLGCGAHLQALRRVRSGEFDLSRALELENLAQGWEQSFVPLEELLPEIPRLDLNEPEARRVGHGNFIPNATSAAGRWRRLFHGGRLMAVAEDRGALLQPVVVLDVWPALGS